MAESRRHGKHYHTVETVNHFCLKRNQWIQWSFFFFFYKLTKISFTLSFSHQNALGVSLKSSSAFPSSNICKVFFSAFAGTLQHIFVCCHYLQTTGRTVYRNTHEHAHGIYKTGTHSENPLHSITRGLKNYRKPLM